MTTPPESSALFAVCALARVALGAAAVSIATVHDDGLRYVAADGAGSDQIVGTLLPPGAGIAGFVAATGQSLSVRDPVSDPRFAREIGDRTGYVPNSIHCVAVLDPDGDVAAVLSVLDRGSVSPADDTVGATRIIGLVVDVATALITVADDAHVENAAGLGALGPEDRVRATAILAAVLDAFES
jgi:hypothetical protein